MSVYVMSDIHGQKERFFKMLDTINFTKNDHLYILGDVVDRGPDGVVLLQYIMKQKNITLLMGNHEYMMLQYYETIASETVDLTTIERWHRNGCDTTLAQMQECSYLQQESIVQYLRNLPLCISDLNVNNKIFYLVHGAPIKSIQSGIVYLDSEYLKLFRVEDFIWNRTKSENAMIEGKTVIVGHTQTAFYHDVKPYQIFQSNFKNSSFIALDCGCAQNDDFTQLACLCLDDFVVYYT